MTALDLGGPHWSFALRLYGQPGVSDACLALQDRLGVDVNVLLLALFAVVERGIPLTASDIADMDRAVAAWRREIILPLREIRRRMKSGPEPAPDEVTEALRQQVKKAELSAEQTEQAVLAHWLDQRHGGGQAEREVDIRGVVASVVSYYAERSCTAEAAADSDAQGATQAIAQVAASMERRTARP
jgi:uncharacterized protein (TIGR02444 family)